jgi:hypothetical protein
MATFENLSIRRLIVHEVVLASALNNNQQPVMSQALTQLDPAGLTLVSRRLAEALGTESHSIAVQIEDSAAGSTFQLATGLLDAKEPDFVVTSQQLAMKLSRAQTIGSIKSGVVVVIDATVGPDAVSRRLAVIVKAESDAAFVKKNLQQGVTLEFVKEMVFGAQQRLFKVGAFLENTGAATPAAADDFEVIVYDHQMNIKGEGSAAQYFYSTFLGATMAASTPPAQPALLRQHGKLHQQQQSHPRGKVGVAGRPDQLLPFNRGNHCRARVCGPPFPGRHREKELPEMPPRGGCARPGNSQGHPFYRQPAQAAPA